MNMNADMQRETIAQIMVEWNDTESYDSAQIALEAEIALALVRIADALEQLQRGISLFPPEL